MRAPYHQAGTAARAVLALCIVHAGSPVSAHPRLADLFQALFSPFELSGFVERRLGSEIHHAVAWFAPYGQVVWELTTALGRRGRINDALTHALLEERPERSAEIIAALGRPAAKPHILQPLADSIRAPGTPGPPGPPAPLGNPGHLLHHLPLAPPSPAQATPSVVPVHRPPAAAISKNSPVNGKPLRILHLSDLHLSPRTGPEHRSILREALSIICSDLVAQGLRPDLVALTGDLADRGAPAEFNLVRDWLIQDLLPALSLGPDRLLVVPGNHDLDRQAAKASLLSLLEDKVADDENVAATIFKNPQHRAEISGRYHAWVQFLTDLGVAHPRTPNWSWRPFGEDHPLLVIGLDTAWLHTHDGAQGRLVLGRRIVDEALDSRKEGDTVIALTHHPLDWLVDWDQIAISPPFERYVHLHLHGHLHQPKPRQISGPAGSLLRLPTGALYAGHTWHNAFQLIELEPTTRGWSVHPFVWLPDEHRWTRDRNRCPPHGTWAFSPRP